MHSDVDALRENYRTMTPSADPLHTLLADCIFESTHNR